jgi:competence ComEA-like helix-hairpin-helix protein
VKQNLPPARFQSALIALVVLAAIISASACARIPRRSSSAVSAVQYNPAPPGTEQVSLVNINTASAQELEKLPGVGRGIAERIVAHREQYGLFRRAEHLMMVRGISDRKFRQLHSFIVVQ